MGNYFRLIFISLKHPHQQTYAKLKFSKRFMTQVLSGTSIISHKTLILYLRNAIFNYNVGCYLYYSGNIKSYVELYFVISKVDFSKNFLVLA